MKLPSHSPVPIQKEGRNWVFVTMDGLAWPPLLRVTKEEEMRRLAEWYSSELWGSPKETCIFFKSVYIYRCGIRARMRLDYFFPERETADLNGFCTLWMWLYRFWGVSGTDLTYYYIRIMHLEKNFVFDHWDSIFDFDSNNWISDFPLIFINLPFCCMMRIQMTVILRW